MGYKAINVRVLRQSTQGCAVCLGIHIPIICLALPTLFVAFCCQYR